MKKRNLLFSSFSKGFTLIEILMVTVLIMILMGMLIPSMTESRKRAKFTRWYAFNKTLSLDPACAINFNFQDAPEAWTADYSPLGADNIAYASANTGSNTSYNNPFIRNSASGCEGDRFDVKNYHGYLRKNLGDFQKSIAPPDPTVFQDCFELAKGGRWGRYKKALKFDGKNAFVDIPADEVIDFTPQDSFTINAWIKVNNRSDIHGIYSKSKWGFLVNESHPRYEELCSSAQYDLYLTRKEGVGGEGVYDVDVFTQCYTAQGGIIKPEEIFNWHMLTLRYDATGETMRGYTDEDGNEVREACPGTTTMFINGKVASNIFAPPNNEAGIYDAAEWAQSTNGKQHFVLGAIGVKPARRRSGLDYFFNGEMDEFTMHRRALKNNEVKAIYNMGAE